MAVSTTRYIVSACLAGIACRYDGRANTCPEVQQMVEAGRAIPACPEFLGGLATPRPPCEITRGRVLTRDGQDVTQHFLLGAQAATEFALQQGCTAAILKNRSPSCGNGQVYDGTFSGVLVKGDGVWVEHLRQAGIALFNEENLPTDLG
ncbi:MAG: DUF523 domain-containing protein [Desulfovibrio sp.]|nr:DUF523 domain-containing protein [Desulfovibrio sp.]